MWLRPHLDFDLHFAFGLVVVVAAVAFDVVDVESVGAVERFVDP